jgi:hypothetical protein
MTLTDVWGVALAIISSVGGGAVIVTWFSSWFGKVWANRILEADKHKYASELESLRDNFIREADRQRTSLKKSEFIFQKEFEAASEFVALARAMDPQHLHPDVDWSDALEQIASSLDSHQRTIEKFMAKYGAVLSEEAESHLRTCLARATDGKFEVHDNGESSGGGLQHADDFYKALLAAEKALIATFRAQARH